MKSGCFVQDQADLLQRNTNARISLRVSPICAMLQCNIQILECLLPQQSGLVPQLQTNP
jgi:hypothetical protein